VEAAGGAAAAAGGRGVRQRGEERERERGLREEERSRERAREGERDGLSLTGSQVLHHVTKRERRPSAVSTTENGYNYYCSEISVVQQ
jgi:hypothetical protein